jgi:Fe-S-cluster-containing hydrogenase component 2
MKAAIEIIAQNRCTGCFGCCNTCPVTNAIEMKYDETGLKTTFVQDNHSRSEKNVLRGLHYHIQQPQGKDGARGSRRCI